MCKVRRMGVFATMFAILALMFVTLQVTGCQKLVKKFGGTLDVTLPVGKKLEMVTWKESDLWFLIRDMRPGEKPETYEFVENSNWGLVEGKVLIHENVKTDTK